MKKWIIYLIALAVIVGACFYVYKIIYPNEPPQVEVTNQALEAAKKAKKENADMKRRLELEKQGQAGKRSRSKCKSVKRLMLCLLMLSLLAVADELRLIPRLRQLK